MLKLSSIYMYRNNQTNNHYPPQINPHKCKCTDSLGKKLNVNRTHMEYSVLKEYNENPTALDYIWTIASQYIMECHKKEEILPTTALGLILV